MFLLPPLALCLYTRSKLLLSTSELWTSKKIVPDMIIAPPEETLVVEYPKVTVNLGDVIQAKQTKYTPKVTWNVKEQGAYYTLIMSDLDSPSKEKPTLREWHSWLVGNIPDNNIQKGQTLTEYIGAGPPKGTGLHRFVFLLYKQPQIISFKSYRITKKQFKGRPKFSSRRFTNTRNMQLCAGNFFEAEYDDFVDELHKQINLEEYLDMYKLPF